MSQAQWWGRREDREILRGFGREIITVIIIAQSTLYAVQYLMDTAYSDIYGIYCTVYSVRCTVYAVHCLMDTVYNAIEWRTVYDVRCLIDIVYSDIVLHTQYGIHCTTYNA